MKLISLIALLISLNVANAHAFKKPRMLIVSVKYNESEMYPFSRKFEITNFECKSYKTKAAQQDCIDDSFNIDAPKFDVCVFDPEIKSEFLKAAIKNCKELE